MELFNDLCYDVSALLVVVKTSSNRSSPVRRATSASFLTRTSGSLRILATSDAFNSSSSQHASRRAWNDILDTGTSTKSISLLPATRTFTAIDTTAGGDAGATLHVAGYAKAASLGKREGEQCVRS